MTDLKKEKMAELVQSCSAGVYIWVDLENLQVSLKEEYMIPDDRVNITARRVLERFLRYNFDQDDGVSVKIFGDLFCYRMRDDLNKLCRRSCVEVMHTPHTYRDRKGLSDSILIAKIANMSGRLREQNKRAMFVILSGDIDVLGGLMVALEDSHIVRIASLAKSLSTDLFKNMHPEVLPITPPYKLNREEMEKYDRVFFLDQYLGEDPVMLAEDYVSKIVSFTTRELSVKEIKLSTILEKSGSVILDVSEDHSEPVKDKSTDTASDLTQWDASMISNSAADIEHSKKLLEILEDMELQKNGKPLSLRDLQENIIKKIGVNNIQAREVIEELDKSNTITILSNGLDFSYYK